MAINERIIYEALSDINYKRELILDIFDVKDKFDHATYVHCIP